MATERGKGIYEEVQSLPVNQAKGRRPALLATLVRIIGDAIPEYDKLQEARSAFKRVTVSMDTAIAQAAALFALDVAQHVMPKHKDAKNPYESVWKPAFGAEWAMVAEKLLPVLGVTKRSSKEIGRASC